MKVRDLIILLEESNPEKDVSVIVYVDNDNFGLTSSVTKTATCCEGSVFIITEDKLARI